MDEEFDAEAARYCVIDEIVGCYNCRPYDEGQPVWLGSHSTLEDVLYDCGIEEEYWDEVFDGLSCPHCGTELTDSWDEVELKSEYDKAVDDTLENAHSPAIIRELFDFHEFLYLFPYLGLGDPKGTGLKIREQIRNWRIQILRPTTWYRARKLSEESRIFNSEEMGAPDPEKVFIKEGRYNHTGQAFLYLSDRPETAFKEVQLANENLCTIQKFRTEKPLSVLDLRHDYRDINPNDNLLALAIIYNGFLERRPGNQNTSWKPEYFVPRFIADCARLEEFDGILFSSAVSYPFENLVVFPSKISVFIPNGKCEVFVWQGDKNLSLF